MRLKIANAGADLDDVPRYVRVNQSQDATVKARIHFLQQRFGFPGAQVALDLHLVLRERCRHRMNLSRRAANITMRNSSQPWLQRWIFVFRSEERRVGKECRS